MLAASGTRRRPLLGVAGALAVAALTVSGCAAGQQAQTVEQTSVVDGTGFTAGDVVGRDVGLRPPTGPSYAAGANAVLEGFLVNQGRGDDTLVSISSPVATKVVFYADGVSALLGTVSSAGAGGSASATPSVTPSATDSASPTGSASSSASATGSASSSAAAAPAPLEQIPLASNQSVQFGYTNGQPAVVFVGLTRALFPAETFPITFTFASGSSVTAQFSVKLPVDSTLDAPTVDTEESEGGE